MSDKPIPRPPQATLCGAAILVGSVFLVLLAFDHMGSLGSIEAQEAATDFVSEPPGEGLGLSADQVQTAQRILCLVAGGAAVAAAILGFHALQRQRSARLALSVVAPVLVVAGTPLGGSIAVVAAVVAAAVTLLWLQPARDWYAGVSTPRPSPSTSQTSHATPTSHPPAYTAPGSTLTETPPVAPARPSPPARPPTSVVNAVRITIVCSAVVAIAMLYGLFVALADRAQLETEIAEQLAGQEMYDGIEPSVVVDVLLVGIVVFVLWAVAAIVLAVLTLRGSDGARVTLVVSAFAAAVASLLGVALVVPLVVTGVCIAVAVLLLRADAGEWFAARRRS